MGHTAQIRCPKCSKVHEYEMKDATVNENQQSVCFDFSCDCGFAKRFEDLSLIEFSSMVPVTDEVQEIADYLGISRQTYESFVWPPDVRNSIDRDRRDLPDSSTKRLLRSSALELPRKHNDQWWLVYDCFPLVVFDPKSQQYGLVSDDGKVTPIGNIAAIVSSLQA